MIHSHALLFKDFGSAWYKHWGPRLKQTEAGRGKFALHANKFWQNAAMVQALHERGALEAGKHGLGFGVGQERLPALFASLDVNVTATDQDFRTGSAAGWNNDQLAQGRRSLNKEKICPETLFRQRVSFQAVDMNRIPKSLAGTYDFLWSNCALGHLGSIDAGLAFIEKSLACLKPGGWAVHTTEVNILSDKETLDNAGTVFFRQRDLERFFIKLSRAGYIVDALRFDLGNSGRDQEFTLMPPWGCDFSKLLFDGHMATQVLLIIHKPAEPPSPAARRVQTAKHRLQYRRNLRSMRKFRQRNRKLGELLASMKAQPAADLSVKPLKTAARLKLAPGGARKLRLAYHNESAASLLRPYGNFAGTTPVALATSDPVNRASRFADSSWYSPDRPLVSFLDGRTGKPLEYVGPGQPFMLELQLAAKRRRPGRYQEKFCLVKEGDGVIPSTEVKVDITVA